MVTYQLGGAFCWPFIYLFAHCTSLTLQWPLSSQGAALTSLPHQAPCFSQVLVLRFQSLGPSPRGIGLQRIVVALLGFCSKWSSDPLFQQIGIFCTELWNPLTCLSHAYSEAPLPGSFPPWVFSISVLWKLVPKEASNVTQYLMFYHQDSEAPLLTEARVQPFISFWKL